MGFETARNQVVAHKGRIGSLSQNFVIISNEFFDGGDIISRANPDFNRYDLEGYEIDIILNALREYELDGEFLSIPVFDALIANQDRHCDNWGVIRMADGTHRLAPLYDNGCSFGHLISESDLDVYMRDSERMDAFIRRGISLIGIPGVRKPKFLKLLSYIRVNNERALAPWINLVGNIQKCDMRDVLNDISDEFIGERRKAFMCELILQRKIWLLRWWKG
ncbi:MAG: HipA domain-containing protein [Bacilli bacterium]